ncbi:MAG: protein-L-isoaspartate O-methyltransferase, partial [Alphaproteobacteria bacterium]
GYQAAVLSQLCRRVYTIERHRSLLKETTQRLARLGIHNVTAIVGDGARGWSEQAPFERIIVTAAAKVAPPALEDQLAVGGIMVIPIGKRSWSQKIVRLRRSEEGFETEKLWPVRFVPLIGD